MRRAVSGGDARLLGRMLTVEIVDLERHLRERAGRGPGRAVERDSTTGDAVQQPVVSLLGRLEAELLR
jgi:hypothetical protein